MIFVILGPSGCGKGTQAKLLAQKFNLAHISTGKLFRQEYEAKSPIGLRAFEWWSKGEWVPTEVAGQILFAELQKYPTGNFILEGWPRIEEQEQVLDKFLEENHLKLDKVFYLETPIEESYKRILDRIEEKKKEGRPVRRDDKPEIIRERFKEYFENIGDILDYYRQRGILAVIDNRPSIGEVHLEICRRINNG